MEYRRTLTLDLPYPDAVARTKEAPTDQRFGILSEIDVQATLRESDWTPP